MKGICILGSTGSIGQQTLAVLDNYLEEYKIVALTASRNWQKLLEQCIQYRPLYAVLMQNESVKEFKQALRAQGLQTEILTGIEALSYVASLTSVEVVVAGIVGAAGLSSTMAAIYAGKRILLANKESLIMAGNIIIQAAKIHKATLLPIDSEHNAIFQCLTSSISTVKRVILTASGGATRDIPIGELEKLTPQEAILHPNWKMGPKITIDSATMMNKALEVIEAYWLFNLAPQQIEVLLHRESIIHSFVEYQDASILAQLSYPDMRVPIAHALAWPQRIYSGARSIDFFNLRQLSFEPLCLKRYPCLQLAYEVLKAEGGSASIFLNAANEAAVEAFLANKIKFTDIYSIIHTVLNAIPNQIIQNIEHILQIDQEARSYAQTLIKEKALAA